MFNHFPSDEVNSPRAMLIKLTGKGNEYGHIMVEFVREAKEKSINPDTMREEYNDGTNAKGYRRTSWSSNAKTAFMIEDLVIKAQMSKDRPDDKPYGVDIEYRNVFSVDKRLAMKMCDTLKRIDAKMTKLDKEFGYASGDLATYITRIASVMGIKTFLTERSDNDGRLSDSFNFKKWNATDVSFLVNELVNEYHGKKD